MIKFKSVSGKKILSYNKVHLKFEDKIYRIFGRNLDTSDEHGTTGNGVGKSLFWSACIANPLYFTTPTSLFKGRGAKDLLGKKSVLRLVLDDYEIEQTSKGFTIFHKGVDQQVRTVPLAKTKIRKIFPLLEEIFYTTTYVSAQRPYMIQRSKDDSRLELFSKLFNLSDYAKLRDSFAQKLRSVKDDEIKAGIHVQNMKDSASRLKELPKIDQDKLLVNKVHLEVINKSVKSLEEHINTTEVELRHLHSVQHIDAILEELRPLYAQKDKPRAALTRLKQEREQEKAYAEYRSDLDEYTEAKKELQAELAELPQQNKKELESKLELLESALEKYKNKQTKLQSELDARELQEQKNAKVLDTLLEAGFKSVKDVPKLDVTEELALYKSVLNLEALLHEHTDGNCPTCNSEIDIKDIEKQVAKAKVNIPKLQKIQRAQKIKDDFKKITIEITESDVQESAKNIDQAKVKIKKIRDSIDKISQRTRIEQSLAKLKEPKSVEKPSWTYKAKEQIEIVQKIVDALNSKSALLEKSQLDTHSTVAQVAKAETKLAYQLAEYKKELVKTQTKQAKIADLIDSAEDKAKERALVKEEYTKAKNFLLELKDNLSRRKLYEALVKAYSPKGIKIEQLRHIMALIEKNFNHYSSLVFGENFKFTNVVTNKGISLQVTRPNGDMSDVRELSGAESDCFILLCLISILPLLDETQRTNLVVLDEPLSHSDEATRIRVINNYLPALHAVVPNLVFISNTPEQVEGSVNLLVTKHNGKSTLAMMDA